MSAAVFICCAECGKKLRTTFFCQECGRPACSLDCYCRHESKHAGTPPETRECRDVDASSTHLEPVQ
jgi:hypothetical protein